MRSLDLQWHNGDVGDHFLRVGRVGKIIHIYQNPWSPLWVLDAPAFGMDKDTYVTLEEAKLVAELAFRDWLENVLYNSQVDHDMIIFSNGDQIDFVFANP